MFGKFYTINFNSYPAMVTIIPTVTITNIQNLALPAVVLLMNNPRTAREAYERKRGISILFLIISDEDSGISAPRKPKKAAIKAPSRDSTNISMPRWPFSR